MPIQRFLLFGVILANLTACDAGHLGNPVTLPVRALGNAAQNAAYDARRRQVAEFVHRHHATLIAEITAGTGPHLSTASDLARIPAARRSDFLRHATTDIALYRNDAEALMVAFMVHGP